MWQDPKITLGAESVVRSSKAWPKVVSRWRLTRLPVARHDRRTDYRLEAKCDNWIDYRSAVDLVHGQLAEAQAGENPRLTEVLKMLGDQFLDFPAVQAALIWLVASSLFDTVAANNDALAKVIPHVDA